MSGSRGRQQRGAQTSDKQIAHTVKDGRLVTVVLPNGHEVTGYVYGLDDYHVCIVEASSLETWLVHKSGLAMRLHADPTFEGEAKRDEIASLVLPFRERVLIDYFGHQPATASAPGR